MSLKRMLASYSVPAGYRAMFRKMGWGAVVDAVEEARRRHGLAEARKQIPDAMLEDAPMAVSSDRDRLGAKLSAYQAAGATRCILACGTSGDDPLRKVSAFLEQASSLRA